MLLGRHRERETLDRLLEAVRAGESRALVVRGEAGVGKTALLEYVCARATGCRVVRAAGVQSEMELAFAGLHQLCSPLLDRLGRLPLPQARALETVFGLSAGPAPDRFFVGLAVLGLLSESAEDRPLVCLVDDAQWLDRASGEALAFVARRLAAEPVALVLAARPVVGRQDWDGVGELEVEGLSDRDAQALLSSAISGRLDERVRDRILAETRGNPLALLELPRGLTPGQLAGGLGLPDALPLSGRIEQSFRRRLDALPADTQRLLLVAAAEPLGEPLLVWRAAARLGLGAEAAEPLDEAGLAEFGARVQFRHPIVRSVVYRAAAPADRREAHAALAEATDREVDPDRRAWHRAHATGSPDEDVAAELERSAGRARARGGLAATAAFLERAVTLTPDAARRAERALHAAQAKQMAGAPDAALALVAVADAGPLDELQRAQAQLLRAQVVVLGTGRSTDPSVLLAAARRLEPLDVGLARETYLDVLVALLFAGFTDGGLAHRAVAEAALAAEQPLPPRAIDRLLDGLALLITADYATAAPTLKRALDAFEHDDLEGAQGFGRGWLACHVATMLWDHESQHALAVRHVQLAREAGALVMLPVTLPMLAGIHMRNGDLGAAATVIEELDTATEAMGAEASRYLSLSLAAFQGREREAVALIGGGLEGAAVEGWGMNVVRWARALLYNGLGRYEEAVAAAREAYVHQQPIGTSSWTLPEIVEAGVRGGMHKMAVGALEQLSAMATVSGTDWALGIEARSRALLSEGAAADHLYREAIERLGRPGVRVELARAHLLYGEWLRRQQRRVDARGQLRIAHDMLTAMGVEAFADRAARELRATGANARKRSVETAGQLTAQEAQIARLARDGLSNPEIGTRLFISRRTVEYHLAKVFSKLDISSRTQLAVALPNEPSAAV